MHNGRSKLSHHQRPARLRVQTLHLYVALCFSQYVFACSSCPFQYLLLDGKLTQCKRRWTTEASTQRLPLRCRRCSLGVVVSECKNFVRISCGLLTPCSQYIHIQFAQCLLKLKCRICMPSYIYIYIYVCKVESCVFGFLGCCNEQTSIRKSEFSCQNVCVVRIKTETWRWFSVIRQSFGVFEWV